MKVLLIYPQYIHSSEFDSRAPSMSLVYLASSLEKSLHKVTIYDASLGKIIKEGKVFRYGVSDRQMQEILKSLSFDVVGITCSFTARWKFAAKIAEQVKCLFPDVPVVVGGLFPTSRWQYCLDNCSFIDLVMLGESEDSFTQFINNLEKGLSISDACYGIEGVGWRENGTLHSNPKVKFNEALDDLPFPAWHLMDLGKYFSLQKRIFELPAPCLPILSSRSCPNRCRFCNMYITHGGKWRWRSAGNVLNEIEYLTKRFDIHNFYFIDDNFSLNLNRAKEICHGIIERKLKIKYNFHNGLSIKTIDYELVQLMKKSGCTSVCLAVESGSEKVRNEIYGKKLNINKIYDVFGWFRQADIPTIGYFLVGAPGEKREDIEKTKKLIAELPLSLATVGIFTPYPGTELYDECRQNGWLTEPDAEDKDRVEMFSPMVKTEDFTPEDVAKWQRELYFSFIHSHWKNLLKEFIRCRGVVNRDIIGKFFGLLKFRYG